MLTSCIVLFALVSLSTQQAGSVDATLDASLGVSLTTQKDWSESSPYMPLALYEPPPVGCTINQVNILERHGARFPTSAVNETIVAALAKFKSVKKFTDPRLDFISSFVYDLGVNDLVPFGASESFNAGGEAFSRYASLISEDNIPFVRSDSSSRVVMSATNWTAGFASASRQKFKPVLSVILSTSNNGNDTLEDGSCPNAGDSTPQVTQWVETFAPPITKILNDGAPGANLTDTDTFGLLNICPFQTLAKEKKSPFCDLFESIPNALAGLEYFGDLDKFYNTGYGQPLGPVQGVGWVNELIARLTDSPVQDHTQTNSTLDSSPVTFPLNRTMYADFSHDDQITAIISAIGLFKQPGVEPLDPTNPNPARIWRAASIVPFASRVVIERLSCATIGPNRQVTASVRILVNQQIQPLEFCGADSRGVCSVDAFVQSQSFARSGGGFAQCFT